MAISRVNNCINPSFETNADHWDGDAATVASSTDFHHEGTRSLKITPEVSGSGATYDVALAAGFQHTVSAWFYSPEARTAQIWVGGTGGSGAVNLPAGEWKRISVTVTPSDSGVRTIYFSSQSTTGLLYIDSVLIEQSATLGDYFDGDRAPAGGLAYTWIGTPHGSTSTEADWRTSDAGPLPVVATLTAAATVQHNVQATTETLAVTTQISADMDVHSSAQVNASLPILASMEAALTRETTATGSLAVTTAAVVNLAVIKEATAALAVLTVLRAAARAHGGYDPGDYDQLPVIGGDANSQVIGGARVAPVIGGSVIAPVVDSVM